MRVVACACFLLSILCLAQTVNAEVPKPLVDSEIIPASPAQVWQAFTTKEGQESWQVSHADVDLRIGGLMRTHYDKVGRLGDANTIQNLIVCFDPERMLSLRIVHPPKNFPFKTAAKSVWTILYFEPAEANQTKVTVKMLGWSDTEEARKMRAFFVSGNRWVLDKLKAHFAKRE